MTKKSVSSSQILAKMPKNQLVSTSDLITFFPGMTMSALGSHLMRLTDKGILDKLGATLYRLPNESAPKQHYRVSRYVVLPLDLFNIVAKYLKDGYTMKDTHLITGIPFESVRFVRDVVNNIIAPPIETKTSIELKKEELSALLAEKAEEEVEEVEEVKVQVEEVEVVKPEVTKVIVTEPEISKAPTYFTIVVQGVTLKVAEGLQLRFKDEAVFIDR
jgi:predicted house-cleaning noncanonical NTP pyrophosphatase (MazG superfamily)